MMADSGRFRGMVLAEACGDALGYPLDRLSVQRIIRRYGPFGLRTLVRTKKTGYVAQISAATQTMLACADGIFWADARRLSCDEGVYRGYMRWFYSQTGEEPRRGQRTWMRRQPHERAFCLVREKFMHARRGGGEASLAALENADRGSLKHRVNDAPDCEGLPSAAPVGLLYAASPDKAFYEGLRCAILTHSSPDAYYASAALAALIAGLADGLSFPKALGEVKRFLAAADGAETVSFAIEKAERLANDSPAGRSGVWDHEDNFRALGAGEKAPEALAAAVYAVMTNDEPFEAILAAANRDGRSSTAAAVTGAIEGVRFGAGFLPPSWLAVLEAADLIGSVGERLWETRGKRLYSAESVQD